MCFSNIIMTTIAVSEEKLHKVLVDVETLISDVTSLLDENSIVKKRVSDIKTTPSMGKSESELDDYLKKRGVQVD